MTNPIADPYKILYKVYSAGEYLKQSLLSADIEEQYRARTVRICYGVLENDRVLSNAITQYADKTPKLAVRVILKISMYLMVYMNKSKYMVTDNAVELCKKLGKGGMGGFVNAFLRRVDEQKLPVIEDKQLAARCESNFPDFAYDAICAEYGERAQGIMKARSMGVCVRFSNADYVAQYSDRSFTPTPFKNLYIFATFKRDENYDKGVYTFQSIGSVAVGSVIERCDKFLDACAAPGGKTVLAAEKCSHVTAFELHGHRVDLIKSYVKRMRVTNVEIIKKDSSVFDAKYAEAFDGVLCDVPCSGLGVACENPDILLTRSAEDVPSLNAQQLKILTTCSKYLARGGNLYYSTCSILQAENDEIIERFLSSEAGRDYSVEPLDCPLMYEKKKYGIQLLPDSAFGAGFYVCKLRRKA